MLQQTLMLPPRICSLQVLASCPGGLCHPAHMGNVCDPLLQQTQVLHQITVGPMGGRQRAVGDLQWNAPAPWQAILWNPGHLLWRTRAPQQSSGNFLVMGPFEVQFGRRAASASAAQKHTPYNPATPCCCAPAHDQGPGRPTLHPPSWPAPSSPAPRAAYRDP